MHAGIVMRRMLEFMRDGIPGRHGQEDDDGTGDNPDDASKSETWHRQKTESMEGMLTNSPTERQRNFRPPCPVESYANASRFTSDEDHAGHTSAIVVNRLGQQANYGPPMPTMRSTRSSRPPRSR